MSPRHPSNEEAHFSLRSCSCLCSELKIHIRIHLSRRSAPVAWGRVLWKSHIVPKKHINMCLSYKQSQSCLQGTNPLPPKWLPSDSRVTPILKSVAPGDGLPPARRPSCDRGLSRRRPWPRPSPKFWCKKSALFLGFMMGTVHGKMIVLENDDCVVIEPKFWWIHHEFPMENCHDNFAIWVCVNLGDPHGLPKNPVVRHDFPHEKSRFLLSVMISCHRRLGESDSL